MMTESVFPLSYGQVALWHIQRLMPANPVYNVCSAWQVLSELDLVALKKTFQWLVDRHPSLRTTYFLRDREPLQMIHPSQKAHFKIHQASDWTDEELEAEISREVLRPFDLEKGPLMRTNIFLREEGKHIGLNSFHHISVDLMSSSMLFDEIGTLYPSAKQKKSPPPPLSIGNYIDFVRWQREMLAGPKGEELWGYWKQQFPEKFEPFSLPFELERPPRPSFAGTSFPFKVNKKLTSRIENLARSLQVTLYTFLLAGFQSLLHLYTGSRLFNIRTLTAGRNRPEFERVIGFYANPVVVKAEFPPSLTFRRLLAGTQKNVVRMLANQDFPFEFLMEKLSFGRGVQYNPNPEIMFTLQTPQKFITATLDQNQASADGIFAPGRTGIRLNLGGLIVEKLNPKQTVTLNDLALEMAQAGNELSGAIHFRTDLFVPGSISEMAENYKELLAFMADNIETKIEAFRPETGFPGPIIRIKRKEKFSKPEISQPLIPQTHTAPRNKTEKKLARIWQEVLDVDHVGVFDDFFKSGGSSLQALQLMALVRDHFHVELPLQQLFDFRTIAGIAETIDTSGAAPRHAPIEKRQKKGKLPLSFSQERLWFQDQLVKGHVLNIPVALRIKGPLQAGLVEKSCRAIGQRHEILRTTFHSDEGKPFMKVDPCDKIKVEIKDMSGLEPEKRETEARKYVSGKAKESFDLQTGPLIRVILVKLKKTEHILFLNMHHIISDAWSLNIFFREWVENYAALATKKPPPLPEVPIQYSDFTIWQRDRLQGDVQKRLAEYWRNRLKNLPQLALLPDHSRSGVRTYRGKSLHFELSRPLSRRLNILSKKNGATLFMTLLSAFKALLCRYTQQEDIAVGTPVSGRHLGEIQGLIGCFINILVLRTDLSGDPSFLELLDRVQEGSLAAYSHQDLPFEKLVEILQPKRELGRDPLIQVMFVFQETDFESIDLPQGLSASHYVFPKETAQYNLTLHMFERAQKLQGMAEFNTDLFERRTIEGFIRHFSRLLAGIADNPESKISDLPLLGKREREKILVDWNDTRRDYPSDKCAHELFEEQVKSSPDSIAVEYKDTSMSYRELDRRANQLGNHLVSSRKSYDGLIGVYLEPSLEMAISLLAILKAGAAYIPLDPSSPHERTKLMIEDAGLSLVLTQNHLAPGLASCRAKMKNGRTFHVTCLDKERSRIRRQSSSKPNSKAGPQNLAYVIYTSGSSGFPNGVKISHRALVNYLTWCDRTYNLKQGKGAPLHTSFAFDFSVTALLAPLAAGQKTILSPRNSEDNVVFSRFKSEPDWSLLKLTPLQAEILGDQLSKKTKSPTRTLVLGGEELKKKHLASWLKYAHGTDICNEYGPTETTVGCCLFRVPRGILKRTSVPIGRPIDNMFCYILDKNLNPTPVGVIGELHIGGIGLAEGYLNRPGLTAERFIPNPFLPDKESRLFKSGDMARYLPSGDIEFFGRKDEQIKIDGYRIEPGEIEAILASHPAVDKAAVTALESRTGKKVLAAYLVGNQTELNDDDIRSHLRSHLPNHMLPEAILWLDKLPLTESGKLDRRALPFPEFTEHGLKKNSTPPQDLLQKKLANIWSEVLGIDQVGIEDNFFELGGQSLQALRLVSLIRKAANVELPLTSVFKAQTISDLASFISEIKNEAVFSGQTDLPKASLITLRAGHEDYPLFCFHPAGGGVSVYRFLADEMEGNYPVYGVECGVAADAQIERLSIEAMAGEYAELIRKRQKRGPYFFLGWSFGSAVAVSTASFLEKKGEKIAFTGLLDPWHPPAVQQFPEPGLIDLLTTILDKTRSEKRRGKEDLYERAFCHFKELEAGLLGCPQQSCAKRITEWLLSLGWNLPGDAVEFIAQKLALGNRHVQLLEAFSPSPVFSPLHLWMPNDAEKHEAESRKKFVSAWTKGRLIFHSARGDHYSMLLPARTKELAASISKSLRAARKGLV